MKKKKSKEKRGMKKAAAKKAGKKAKVSAKAKRVPAKKKAGKGRAKIKKKKIAKKETEKVKAKVKKKKVAKAVKKEKKKVKARIRVKKEEKAKKKRVAKKVEKKIPPAPPLPVEILPEEYGEDSIALMAVDPRKLFTYWEVREDTLVKHIGDLNIRLYDVTGVDFDGTNANGYFDIAVNNRIGSWYIDVNPEREFIADIGVIDPAGVFIKVARSNKVLTPREGIVEEGVLPKRLYETGLPIGYRK